MLGRHAVGDHQGTRRRLAMLATSVCGIVACSGSPSVGTVTTTSTSVVTTLPPTRSDGVLRIGILLPRSGDGATFGGPLLAAADMAIDEINLLGGVNGRNISVQVKDEGDDPAGAMQLLIDGDVDVIVGPASSNVAVLVLGQAVEAGRAVCSPTATAIGLSDFPDNGLFLRTIPSDALQADALASLIDRTGSPSAVALIPDDEFGRRYLESLRAALAEQKVELEEPILYDPTSDSLSPPAAAALAGDPAVLVVVGDLVNGSRMIAALSRATNDLPQIFVNEALRSADIVDAIGSDSSDVLSQISGAAPPALPHDTEAGRLFVERFIADNGTQPLEFASYAYDCVMALALAAEATGTDDPTLIAGSASQVTRDGQPCIDFESCRLLLRSGRNIDYEGSSGPLELDGNGDVSVAELDEFAFDEAGTEVVRSIIQTT